MDELTLAIAEACAWLRSIQRNRTGEDVAARLEAANPPALEALRAAYPGHAYHWPLEAEEP